MIGDNPTAPPEVSFGDRFVFYEKTGTNPYKIAIGVDNDRTVWFQSTGDVSQDGEEGGFDWYCSGASTGQMLRRMRLSESGQLLVSTGDAVEVSMATIDGPIAQPVDFVINGGTLALQRTNHFIVCDATGGTCTVTLPGPADAEGVMFEFIRINAGANDLVVDAGGSTIDGAANKTLASQYAAITVRSDGIEWWMITEKGTVT